MEMTVTVGDADTFPCYQCGESLEIPKYSGYHYCPKCNKEYQFNRAHGQVSISFNEEFRRNSEERLNGSVENIKSSSQVSSSFQQFFPVSNVARISRRFIFVGWVFLCITASIATILYRNLVTLIIWLIVVVIWILYSYIESKYYS
jgi:hypothetical protein